MPKLINLGCKLNQYDGHALKSLYRGLTDIIIVNTCCVTKEAEIKSLKKFRRALRLNPYAKVIATGCASHHDPGKYNKAYKIINNMERSGLISATKPEPEKARYFLKIQDGCNGKCNYCIVPKVRDRIISKGINEVVNEIEWAHKQAYKEIVLVGANLGLYGFNQDWNLIDLFAELSHMPDIPRIRLSSIEPRFITHNLLIALSSIPFCPHFHIPIQSADDFILARMGRGYSAAEIENKIKLINDRFDRVAIGADIIVGYPGEDDSSFNNTLRFIEKNNFTHLHVFPYSPRPGTAAFDLGDPVPKYVKKNRLHILYDLIKEKQRRFGEQMIGSVVDVIVDKAGLKDSGLTDNYLRVILNHKAKIGDIYKVKIESSNETLFGTILERRNY
ncbi:hypothetical protein A2Y85_05645 [candidate division WOR-3 bacterium RBG_13_43_14]|uniref:tRNA (N(6)-L-threonylcarbamoyladenosine(37)-C(2))-methylthiotransferase MtaB n=1 Tax=candidate division WOR-3 bacterium RBG_13_43_14 TaxID=1802590 RepID=A0A1F4UF91_UNCW3|nr:MAG: hypothetical protein A2Y85_05645 [candidate division WOR-3 bacterium RBG_13_43_14]